MTTQTHVTTSGGLISAAFIENVRQRSHSLSEQIRPPAGTPWQIAFPWICTDRAVLLRSLLQETRGNGIMAMIVA